MIRSLRKFWKIRVYVPTDGNSRHTLSAGIDITADKNVRAVVEALESVAGVGRVGNYDNICELAIGWEEYRAKAGASPQYGAIGERISLVAVAVTSFLDYQSDATLMQRALDAVKAVHPWEHPIVEFSECLLYVPEV